jgi:Glycosyl hydrolase family 12/Cellulose binding domain/Fibronectin type III domain
MKPSKHRRLVSLAAAGAVAVAAATVSIVAALPAAAATICEQFGTVDSSGYVIMNNRWGSPGPQCIETTSTGFRITQQDGMGNTSGAPASYPAIYLGCHYTRCSQTTSLPRQISQIGSAPGSISVSYPGSGTWNAAYDIWINADNNVSGVQDTEIMIWLNRQGGIQPIGSPSNTVNIAGRSWQAWTGNNGQNNVVSYLFQGSALTSFSFDVMDFVDDTISRGSQWGTNNWWLTSVQAGFEPWIGGVGLTVNNFSQTVNSGQQNPLPPGTPGTPTCTTTANSVSLNWGASSGTVNQYVIQRATGATSTTFTQAGTSTTTSFTDGGRSANTTYRYRIQAQNSAGSSGFSGTVNCTTTGSQTTTSQPPGGCSGTYQTTNAWSGGFQGGITVTNTSSSTITSWRITFSLGGATIVNFWGGRASGSSYINEPWNGTLAPNASTTFGFVANGSPPGSVTVTCTTPA